VISWLQNIFSNATCTRRYIKPGGKLFFVDSAQVGDGKMLGMEMAFDQALERFPQFNHEPYYRDYANCSLEETFGEFGLELEESTVVGSNPVVDPAVEYSC
jgi:hypothetical protein